MIVHLNVHKRQFALLSTNKIASVVNWIAIVATTLAVLWPKAPIETTLEDSPRADLVIDISTEASLKEFDFARAIGAGG